MTEFSFERDAQPVHRVAWTNGRMRHRRYFYSRGEAEAFRDQLEWASVYTNVDPFKAGA